MIEIVACLALALCVVGNLWFSRRRLARLLEAEQSKSRACELAAKAALQERLAVDIAVIVAPLRTLLEEQAVARAASAAEVAQLVASFRALVEWYAAFAASQYAQAHASAEASQETVRKQERAPRAAPSIAPPGGAEVLPSAPAQIAAGLGPRPSSRPLSASTTPHLPPVRVGTSRRPTLLGINKPPLAPPQPSQQDSGDSGAWLSERPSDADGERTRVGVRPSPEALNLPPLHGSSPTLPSMQAPTTSRENRGGS